MIDDSKARILIVEDKYIVAEDLANTLRKLGYDVPETVMSGEEALDRVREFQPDLESRGMIRLRNRGSISKSWVFAVKPN